MNESFRPDAIDSSEFELSWNELVEASGLSDKQIQEQIDFLILAEEVNDKEVNFNSCYMIRQKGTTSFYDRKYLDIGLKEFKDDLYDVLKLLYAGRGYRTPNHYLKGWNLALSYFERFGIYCVINIEPQKGFKR